MRTADGVLQTENDWKVEPTLIEKGASFGSLAKIFASLTSGENAVAKAGSVGYNRGPADSVVVGNSARVLRSGVSVARRDTK